MCQHLSKKLEQICSGMTERIFSMTDRCMRIHMLQDIDRQLIQEFNAIPLYQNVLQVTSSENVKGLMLDEEGGLICTPCGCPNKKEGSIIEPSPSFKMLPCFGIDQRRQSRTSHMLGNDHDHAFHIQCRTLHKYRRKVRKFLS